MGFFTSCCTLAAVTAASTIACYGYTLYARVIEPTNPGLADLHMFIYFVALWSFRGVYTQQTFALAYNIGIWKGSDPPLVRTSAQFYKAQLLAGGESSIHFDQIATEPCEPPTSTVVSKKKMRALDPFGAGWLVLYQLTMVSQLLHLAWYTSVVSNNFTVSDRRQYLNGWDTPQHMQTYWTIAGYIFLLGITPVVFRTRILRNDPTNITHKTSILGFLILLPGSMSWPLVLLGINWAPFVMLAFVLLAIVYHIGQAIYFNRAGKIVWLTRNFDVLFGVYLTLQSSGPSRHLPGPSRPP
ncbi:hypothetical protein BC828DRAFT_224610 [Blastocladiella britannica]|nr:hypothetical protein BC828DRAFT_224610 [Blastocladiella britannica]